MASLKVVLRKKQNKDGTYPLAIRVTKDRKTSFIHLGHHLHEKEWDEKNQKVKSSHQNSGWLNGVIATRKKEAYDTLLKLQVEKDDLSSQVVTAKIKPKVGSSFNDQAKAFLANHRGKYNRVKTDESRIKYFQEFLRNRDVTFAEINVPLLKRFIAWLRTERNVSERTITNYLILIRAIYNHAIAAEAVDPKHYPFGKGKISISIPESEKIGLNAEDVQKIEALDLSELPAWNHARNLWLMAFYLAGARVSDILQMKWSDFQNGRYYYRMGKNQKMCNLQPPAKVFDIIEQYRDDEQKHDLIFPELKKLPNLDDDFEIDRLIAYKTKLIDKYLRYIAKHKDVKLTKKFTMHIARHTFGNLAGKNVSLRVLQEAFRHSSLTTTANYMRAFVTDDLDNALDTVVNFKAVNDNKQVARAIKRQPAEKIRKKSINVNM